MAIELLELKTKTKQGFSTKLVVQLALNLFALYVANKISIDVWRSIRGH
jgi:hypothetical protein